MRILLGMSFGEAESSDTLLGVEILGLRNWMKEEGKREITTNRVLLGFGGDISSRGFQVKYRRNLKNSRQMCLSECEWRRWDTQSFALAGSSIGPTLKR
jgi:hypothetical protein